MPRSQQHNESCALCGAFAGHESSPEGSACSTCDRWVCDTHVDYAYMRQLHEQASAKGVEFESADPICTACGGDGAIPAGYPAY